MPSIIKGTDFPAKLGDKGKGRCGDSHHPVKWDYHQFNCFDGEGMAIKGKHEYVYLAAFDGEQYYEVSNPNGLGTVQCFRFLINVAKTKPNGINVIFSGDYDANMMLKSVNPLVLHELHHKGTCRWKEWRINWIPHKVFTVVHVPTKLSCTLWDVFGFFQSSFVRTIKEWLDITDETITTGKAGRHGFTLAELPFIIDYCKRELVFLEKLMQRLWESLNKVGIKLSRWDGAGAAAQSVLTNRKVSNAKGTVEQNEKHYYQARCAYAGGRFELIRPGDYRQPIFNYDINSAYPYGMSLLPPFTGLRKCRKKRCEFGPYDLLRIEYDATIDPDWHEILFHPYFHRMNTLQVVYPTCTLGWHWGIEWLASGKLGDVVEHLHWDDNGERPFAWIADYYQYRKELQDNDDQAEKAVKLVLNSLYGKVAQQKGWRPETDKKPAFHQLYWAGWITALTRSMMYQAMSQHPNGVIAVETDGLFTTKECDLPLGKGLGEWGLKTYRDITYVQSGMYFGTKDDGSAIVRYRGLDPGQLTREMVLEAWEAGITKVSATSTRFRTLGTSLQGGTRLNQWRQWVTDIKQVNLLPQGKRMPDFYDNAPWGFNCSHATIPFTPPFQHSLKNLESHPYNVLWADMGAKLEYMQEWLYDYEWDAYEA